MKADEMFEKLGIYINENDEVIQPLSAIEINSVLAHELYESLCFRLGDNKC